MAYPKIKAERAGSWIVLGCRPFLIHLVYGMGDMPLAQQSSDFGAGNRLTCAECGGAMILTRRGPHPDYGVEYEAQTFTCSACLYELERSVNSVGEPHQ